MAFLDWIRNRNAEKQQAVAQPQQTQRPPHAREFFRSQAAEDAGRVLPIGTLPPDARKELEHVKSTLQQQDMGQRMPHTPELPDIAGTQEAMRQKMTRQETVAPAQSPTSAERGQPDTERVPQAPDEKPVVAPTRTPPPPRPQTLPRPRPSWQR